MNDNFIFMLCKINTKVAQAENVMKGFLAELGYE